MLSKTIYSVTAVIVAFCCLQAYMKMDDVTPMASDLAMKPDRLMMEVEKNMHDRKKLVCVEYLEDARYLLKSFEKSVDEVATRALENAINDIHMVEGYIRDGKIDDVMIHAAFADAMNSMAFASLQVSENLLKEGNEKDASKTLKYAMMHLQNSIKYASGAQKEREIQIAHHLSEIINNHMENDLSKIDEVMVEIDSVVKVHLIR